MENRYPRLAAALADLSFPARRWQLIAQAKDYGADAQTQIELHSLPERAYADVSDVVTAVDSREVVFARQHGGPITVPVHLRRRDEDRRSVPPGSLITRPVRGRGPSRWPEGLQST